MKKSLLSNLMSFIFLSCFSLSSHADYSAHAEFIQFAQEMEQKNNFKHEELMQWFSQAEKQEAILSAISKPAEQSKTWGEYRKIFLTEKRAEQGREFWKKHQSTIEKASQTYQVPESIIVAIIGVETSYGRNTGKYRVIDALSTLAFDYPPRAPFFRKELAEFLLLARENNLDPMTITGSYAGAMGYSQFIPSSYRNYAVDMNGDKTIDLHNPEDAIGSVAHYFQKNGWQKDGVVVLQANFKEEKSTENNFTAPTYKAEKPTLSLSELKKQGLELAAVHIMDESTPAIALILQNEQGTEYWLGFKNFYVITRYNRSPLYAMAVYQLSQQLETNRVEKLAPPQTKPIHLYHKYDHI